MLQLEFEFSFQADRTGQKNQHWKEENHNYAFIFQDIKQSYLID